MGLFIEARWINSWLYSQFNNEISWLKHFTKLEVCRELARWIAMTKVSWQSPFPKMLKTRWTLFRHRVIQNLKCNVFHKLKQLYLFFRHANLQILRITKLSDKFSQILLNYHEKQHLLCDTCQRDYWTPRFARYI